jgi:hypothetical protein
MDEERAARLLYRNGDKGVNLPLPRALLTKRDLQFSEKHTVIVRRPLRRPAGAAPCRHAQPGGTEARTKLGDPHPEARPEVFTEVVGMDQGDEGRRLMVDLEDGRRRIERSRRLPQLVEEVLQRRLASRDIGKAKRASHPAHELPERILLHLFRQSWTDLQVEGVHDSGGRHGFGLRPARLARDRSFIGQTLPIAEHHTGPDGGDRR